MNEQTNEVILALTLFYAPDIWGFKTSAPFTKRTLYTIHFLYTRKRRRLATQTPALCVANYNKLHETSAPFLVRIWFFPLHEY